MTDFTVPAEQLRWEPSEQELGKSAARAPAEQPAWIGQSAARATLRAAIESQPRRFHAYVRGIDDSGRHALVEDLLRREKPPAARSLDFCYVHNFSNPDRPRLIVLAGGQGRQFQQAMTNISLFVRDRLPEILNNDPIRSRREARLEAAEREIRRKISPLEEKLNKNGLALMRSQSGPTSRVAIYGQVMGRPVSPEEYRNLVTQGQAREEERTETLKKIDQWQPEVNRAAHEINQIWQQAIQHVDQINATETARILSELTSEIGRRFKAAGMDVFLREIIDDIVEKRVAHETSHLADPTLLYGVNVLTARTQHDLAPRVRTSQPSVTNLFGTVDPAWTSGGRAVTSFRGIRTGALLEADGGFLILDAEDVLAEPGCWRLLMRALRTGLSEVVPPELGWPYSAQSLKPEPIEIQACVILVGNEATYERLMREDRDFGRLFNLLVDLDYTLPRDARGLSDYASFLISLAAHESLPAFDPGGLAAMCTHGARLADEPGRLSARSGAMARLAREAAAIARQDGCEHIGRDQVDQALHARRTRNQGPMDRFLRTLDQPRSVFQAQGRSELRINSTGLLPHGTHASAVPVTVLAAVSATHPARVRQLDEATPEPLDIIISQLLRLDRPLAVSVTLSSLDARFSGDPGLGLARACLVLAALARLPLRQDIAVIGAIDLHGRARAIDRINDRIEAFFRLAEHIGLSGRQAVIIPRISQPTLMLDTELVKACRNDLFNVWAVDTVVQALELVTGHRAGVWKDGQFAEDTVLGRARNGAMGA